MAAFIPALHAASDPRVFDAPPAEYALPVPDANAAPSPALRLLTVIERTGQARVRELVRVPLFFAAGEVKEPGELVVLDAAGEALEVQTEDIRRGPDGGLARCTLWFEASLPAHGRTTYHLVRRAKAPAARAGGFANERDDEILVQSEDDGFARFSVQTGALLELRSGEAQLRSRRGLAPEIELALAASGGAARTVRLPNDAASGRVRWASGPLLTKIEVEYRHAEVTARLEYRISRRGRALTITGVILPTREATTTVRKQLWLAGEIDGGWRVEALPAGLWPSLAAEQAMTFNVLVAARTGASLVVVPVAWGGASGRVTLHEDRLSLSATSGIGNGGENSPQTLHGFWSEAQLRWDLSQDPAGRRGTFLTAVQPLVAVVDDPRISATTLHAAIVDVVRATQPTDWRQLAGRADLLGEAESRDRSMRPRDWERNANSLVANARRSRAAILAKQGRIAEHDKGRTAGALDPYHVTYTHSPVLALWALGRVPEQMAEVGSAYARASQLAIGRVDPSGWPYIDCFFRAINMQMGATLAGLITPDPDVNRFYRDLATAAPIVGVAGKAQRPYAGRAAVGSEYSDLNYQAITDFWLRSAELLTGEDLQLHPLAYSRFSDAIDVRADEYHPFDAHKQRPSPLVRVNFFRLQPHTHRWLALSCAPFMLPLERPGDSVGATEAWHYTRAIKDRWRNWPNLTYYLLAGWGITEPPRPRVSLPAAPTGVRWSEERRGVRISWDKVPGAAGYHIYRAKHAAGPWHWVTSPHHLKKPGTLVRELEYRDDAGAPSDFYLVRAVSADGRYSRW
ncbi:MAG TPA: hypothetical protein VHF69_05495 [Candidatus Synoicihabitans sp.]|nr:hypothetical protein [Candidatus Synoicihabitans sp.]